MSSAGLDSGFSFSQIHIIESLPQEEWHSGRELYRAIISERPDAYEHLQLREAGDPLLLRANLAAIYEEARGGARWPFIQFECHGHPSGLSLASGDLVCWSELIELLTPINEACRLNLFASMASCFGENFVTAVDLTRSAPLFGLVGPRESQTAGFLNDFFKTFFVKLLAQPDLRKALTAAGGGLPFERRPMVLWPAEYLFEKVFELYLNSEATPVVVARRAKKLAARIQQEGGLPVEARREIARNLRHDLRRHDVWFERCLRKFLMLDKFPENSARFNLEWTGFQERRAWVQPH